METILKKIEALIQAASDIAVIPHCNPDGDAIGAMLGLTLFLKARGIPVRAISPSPPSERYAFLEGFEVIEVAESLPDSIDLVIFVDSTDAERAYPLKLPPDFRGKIINIDHHEDNTRFGEVNLVLPEVSSSGEIIANLCTSMGGELSAAVAAALYVAILTDTGAFHFRNTAPQTLRVAADLIEAGADPRLLTYLLYELITYRRLQLLALVLATLDKSASGEIAWIKVTGEMFAATGTDAADVEDFVNQVANVEGVKIAVLFREEAADKTKVSIRTIEGIKANAIAARFGGGGHAVAAGCRLDVSMSDCVPELLAACAEAL